MTGSTGSADSRNAARDTAEDSSEDTPAATAGGKGAAAPAASHSLFDALDGPGGGDEAGAVKPWLGAIRAPKVPPPVNASAPNAQLDLQWVHGYTSASAGAKNTKISSNLFYNANNCPVYPAAALAVQLTTGDAKSRTEGEQDVRAGYKQSYFVGHDDDVLCLAISKDRRYIATGQTASKTSKGKAGVIIWDAAQCRMLCRLDACHQRAVTSVAFNPEGNQLLSVGQDDSNTHILWEDKGGGWSKAMQVASAKGDKSPVRYSCT
jgi:WD40 repeat protein